jgi:hypothetical protein
VSPGQILRLPNLLETLMRGPSQPLPGA